MIQHGDLLGTCSEVARERDRAVSEAKLLREELNKLVKPVRSGRNVCGSTLYLVFGKCCWLSD